MNGETIALLAILLVAVENSGTAAIAKKGLTEIPPLSLAFLRFVVASIFVLPVFLHKKGHQLSQMREIFPISFFASILENSSHLVLFLVVFLPSLEHILW